MKLQAIKNRIKELLKKAEITTNNAITPRYSRMYFVYFGEGTLAKYNKKNIAFAGKVEDAPPYLKDCIREDTEAGNTDNYVIIFDNWK